LRYDLISVITDNTSFVILIGSGRSVQRGTRC